jgi:dUTP pyrophosphatase
VDSQALEVCIINLNLGDKESVIMDGERMCQMVIAKHERAEFTHADELIKENKIHGAIGHTGKH